DGTIAGRSTLRPGAEALHRAAGRDGRIQAGPRDIDDGAGLTKGRFRRLEVLVGDVDLPLQIIEDRIAVDGPPRTAALPIARLARFPALRLLVGHGCRRLGALIVRAYRA